MKIFLITGLVAMAMLLSVVDLSNAQQASYQTKCQTPAEQALKIKTGRC